MILSPALQNLEDPRLVLERRHASEWAISANQDPSPATLSGLLYEQMNLVHQQQTIRESVEFSGIGLHSGNKVHMRFLPAPPGAGIVFRRMDLEGQPEIPAVLESVYETNRSTTLSKGPTKVHTVEHVLAAFAGYGVDNVCVELDSIEPPIADGSSRQYCRMIETAGVELQEATRETYAVTEPIHLQLAESVMSVFPHDRFKITCTSSDKEGRFTEVYSVEITPETWEKEIAHARTFCFFDEIEYLITHGLIKGGSLENAVIIRDDAVLTKEPLRYTNEFVRHKILDVIGDISLVGCPLTGHFIVVRPGHAANYELAKKIAEQMRLPRERAQTFAPPPPSVRAESAKPPQLAARSEHFGEEVEMDPEIAPTELGVTDIMKLLPHRYPFLMIDRVAKIDGNRIVAVKNVSINEPFFKGHFPDHPIMPGVLQLEAIAQAAGVLMLRKAENTGKLAYFMSAENVKWRKPVLPGDVLVIDVELFKVRGKIGKAKGTCYVNKEIVSEASVTFMLADR